MGRDAIPTYPSEYDPTGTTNNPPGNDSRTEGDEQFRDLKANMKQTWTNVAGAVTASHEEINRLVGVSLTNPIITLPSGTKATVYQDTAPPEWTIDAIPDEMIMRVTKGLAGGGIEGGTSGGANDFSNQFAAHAEDATYGVRNHTLTVSQMPGHAHGGATGHHVHNFPYHAASAGNRNFGAGTGWGLTAGGAQMAINSTTAVTTTMINSSAASISPEGGDEGHAHTLDLAAKWSAFIIITKD